MVQGWPSWHLPVLALVVVLIGQFLEGNVLSPKLVGDKVGLHPVWLIFALLAFGSVWGFTGLIVAVPVASAIGVLLRFATKRYRESPIYTGEVKTDPPVRALVQETPQEPPLVAPPQPVPGATHLTWRASDDVSRQLIFDLGRAPSFDPDDFLTSPSNAEAHAMIERWPDWPGRTLILTGPPGCGKSHLGAIWAGRAGARIAGPGDILDVSTWTSPVVALLEDCDRARHPEAALFHLMNLAKEGGGWLLFTSREAPSLWDVRTPDLLSRLRLAPVVPIGRPDPPLLRAVIVKLFADRQIRIDEEVVAYAERHCDQSLEAINRFVAAVDDESLAAGRRITRPLAAKAIATLERERPTLED